MNWFEKTLGFSEVSPQQVRSNLSLEGTRIRSEVNGAVLGCGWLEISRLSQLRARSQAYPDRGPSIVT